MKRKAVSLIVLILLSTSMSSSSFVIQTIKSESGTWIVDDDLKDYPDADFTKIQDAVDSAVAGDSILVYPGTYTENVNVNKDYLTIKSESGAEVTIVQAANLGDHVFEVTADYVNIKEFTVKGATGTYKAGIYLFLAEFCNISNNSATNNEYGIYLSTYSNNNKILNNTLIGNGFYVVNSYHNTVRNNTVNSRPLVYLEDASGQTITDMDAGQVILVNCHNITVKNLNLSNVTVGVELWETNNSKIRNNTVLNNWHGIYLHSSSNNTIAENNASNNNYGIWMMYCSDNTVINNTANSNHDFGIYLSYSSNNILMNNSVKFNNLCGIYLQNKNSNNTLGNNTVSNNDMCLVESSYNILTNNVISNSGYYGIELYNSSYNTLMNNLITNSGYYGIGLDSSGNNIICGNEISANNAFGIELIESSNNTIYHSNFINNTNQVYIEISVNVWDDGYPSGGNYWSNYTDVDLYSGPHQNETGSDGIWDHPYVIDANNTDHYPLVNPWAEVTPRNITTHQGDLVIEGNQTFLIENCTYIQSGNIYVRDNASLIVKNTELRVSQTDWFEYEIQVNMSAKFTTINALITSESAFQIRLAGSAHASINSTMMPYLLRPGWIATRILAVENSTIDIYNSTIPRLRTAPSRTTIYRSTLQEVIVERSSVCLIYDSTIEGWFDIGFGNSTVFVYNSTLDEIYPFFHESEVTLTNLMSGLHEFWNIYVNETIQGGGEWDRWNLTLVNTRVKDGWGIIGWGSPNISIYSSDLAFVGPWFGSAINVYNSTIREPYLWFEGNSNAVLSDLNPLTYQYWNIYENEIVTGIEWNFTIVNTVITSGWSATVRDNSTISISNSTIIELDFDTNTTVQIYNSGVDYLTTALFHGVLIMDNTIIRRNWTIYWSPHPWFAPPEIQSFFVWGNVSFTGGFYFSDSNVTRNFNIIALNETGDPVENVEIKLYEPNNVLIWSGFTDSHGYASFNVTFTSSNYTDTLTLEAVKGNFSFINDVSLISDTPIILSMARTFFVTKNETKYTVTTFSNSSLTNFKYDEMLTQVSFNATGPSGTVGFTNMTIPKELGNPLEVLVDGVPVSYVQTENSTHYFIYFEFSLSTHTVAIQFAIADIAITNITLSKTVVGRGYTINITVTVENQGNYPETFNVTVYTNATAIGIQTVNNILNVTSTILTFMWNTSGFAYGNYTISAYAGSVLGETDMIDNSMVKGWVFVTLPGDVDGDRDVDIFDIVRIAGVYGVTLPDTRYDPNCDIDGDGDIDIFDVVAAAGNYGESW